MKLQNIVLVFLFSLVSNYSFSQINQDLEAYYPFDGDIQDYSNNGNHLQLLSSANFFYDTDRDGNSNSAVLFNGTGGLRSILPFDNSTFTECSISFWFKTNGTYSNHQCIVQGANSGFGALININSSNLRGFFNSSYSSSMIVQNSINNNQWHHAVLTNDGSVTRAYLNGVLVAQQNESLVTALSLSGTPYLYVGRTNLTTMYYNGMVDELRIYSRALPLSDINQLLNPQSSLSIITSQTSIISCNGDQTGAISVNVNSGTPPYNYLWSNGVTSSSISNLNAGTYTVTVTDANSNTATSSFVISEPAALVNNLSNSNFSSCSESSDGFLQVSTTGGVAPFNYDWSNGSTSNTNFNLGVGVYTLTVTDANGCNKNETYAINQLPAPLVDIGDDTVYCEDLWPGAVTILAQGTGISTYQWSTGQSGNAITITNPGVYFVQVEGTNGCLASDTISITTEICSGISDEFAQSFKVFPNPVRNELLLDLQNTEYSNLKIDLLNSIGQVIYNRDFKDNYLIHSIPVGNYPEGIYFLRLNFDSQTEILKIVKQ